MLQNEHNEKRITACSASLVDNLEHPQSAELGSAVRVSFKTYCNEGHFFEWCGELRTRS
jgi:hypothetical protein